MTGVINLNMYSIMTIKSFFRLMGLNKYYKQHLQLWYLLSANRMPTLPAAYVLCDNTVQILPFDP